MAADKSFEWISMSLGKARWIPFNVDKEIARAFSTPCPRPSETHVYGEIIEAVSKWADEARESIIHWVVGEQVVWSWHTRSAVLLAATVSNCRFET